MKNEVEFGVLWVLCCRFVDWKREMPQLHIYIDLFRTQKPLTSQCKQSQVSIKQSAIKNGTEH